MYGLHIHDLSKFVVHELLSYPDNSRCNEQSAPVEGYYRSRGKLLDFNVGGGIPETWPNLLAALNLTDKASEEGDQQKLAA